MTIQEYFGDWSKVLDLTEAEKIVKRLSVSSYNICPQLKNIFKAFEICSLNNLRVVILGLDPYNNYVNGMPVATGIAFANSSDTPEHLYSPSLEVLMNSVIDYTIPHERIIFDPSLEKWESQGVLLLNAALSCEKGKPESHTLIWRPFIKSLLLNLSNYHTGIVYVLMGTVAQSFEPFITATSNHIVRIRHPSWFARQKQNMPSNLWKDINTILIGQNGYGIEWFEEQNY